MRCFGKVVEYLKKWFPTKEIGWKAHNEIFYRTTLLKTRWGCIYFHRLWAPNWIPESHDHPWNFLTVILKGGYWEQVNCRKIFWRWPGSILYRPAEFVHNVKTKGWMWSLVFVGPKRREWSFGHCDEAYQSPAIIRIGDKEAIDEVYLHAA